MQIGSHVFRFAPSDSSLLSSHGVHAYFIIDGEAAMIDPYDGRDEVVHAQLDQLKALGGDPLKMMLITHRHFDHFEGAPKIKQATGAFLGAQTLEAPAIDEYLKTKVVDRLLEDGEVLEIGNLHLEVIHTPGHTVGGMCLYLREEKILFSGDHIMGLGSVVVGPPEGEVTPYIESLRRLLTYDIALICPGHGPLISQPRAKIEGLIEHRMEREEQVVASLKAGAKGPDDLVKEIYPEINDRLLPLARRTMLGHLIKLQQDGVAMPLDGDDGTWKLL